MTSLSALYSKLSTFDHFDCSGKVVATKGPIITAKLPTGAVGEICEISTRDRGVIKAQIVAFSDDLIYLAPFDPTSGIFPGALVQNSGKKLKVRVSCDLIGTVLDSLGKPMDGSKIGDDKIGCDYTVREIAAPPPHPLARTPISAPLITGIRSLDSCCTIGAGQRVGLFAGAGTGKSTLLGMIARNTDAEVIVVALVGERGREVREFISDSLGYKGLERSVVVVSTSDDTPIRRAAAPLTATAIAEYFRDQGKSVLLLVDSITRTARALREIGLAAGELPVRQGYTPSVFSELPRLLERGGTNEKGSITAIYTVLTAAENDIDPIAEEIKSILDGHIVLSSQVAREGIRPSIDLLNSVSRLYTKLNSDVTLKANGKLIRALSRLRRDRDISLLGGTPDPELKSIIEAEGSIRSFLNQGTHEVNNYEESLGRLIKLSEALPD